MAFQVKSSEKKFINRKRPTPPMRGHLDEGAKWRYRGWPVSVARPTAQLELVRE
jgi:hypothetical protein